MTSEELDGLACAARHANLEYLDLLDVALPWDRTPDIERTRWRRIAEAVVLAKALDE